MSTPLRPVSSTGSLLRRETVQVHDQALVVGPECRLAEQVTVNVVRSDGIAREIRVVCACGREIILECEYSTEGGA